MQGRPQEGRESRAGSEKSWLGLEHDSFFSDYLASGVTAGRVWEARKAGPGPENSHGTRY